MPPRTGKTQADIINTLASAGFAGNNYPDVYLKELSIDGAQIQVLVIKDLPEKPYYLQREYNNPGVRLNPGTIYSRVRDSNTPSNQVASADDIESMWRERFGLDCSPLERMRAFLLNFDDWTPTSENSWYYTYFPEFTVSETDEETREVEGGLNWVRAAINPRAFVRPMKLSYHQTVLATVTCIYYNEDRQMTPEPKLNSDPINYDLWFYSIEVGTLDFLFLQFLSRLDQASLMDNGLKGDVPIIVFRSSNERKIFVEEIQANPITVNDKHSFKNSPRDTGISAKDRDIIAYSRTVIERLKTWRAKGGA